jgi:REP element-mobilizing transposase RayT
MDHAPYFLDARRREMVLEAVRDVFVRRGWRLYSAHVRTAQVHAIVEAGVRPEKVTDNFKAYASRQWKQLEMDKPDRERWSRHGSTRWLWNGRDVLEAVRYVVDELL